VISPASQRRRPQAAECCDFIRLIQCHGPNGEHHWPFPRLGSSFHSLTVAKKLFDPLRYYVCQQISRGVAFLHDQGVCHDSKVLTIGPARAHSQMKYKRRSYHSNVVLKLLDIRYMCPTGLYQLLGPINAAKLKLPNGSYLPHAQKRVVPIPDLSDLDLSTLVGTRIAHFGQVFFGPSTLFVRSPYLILYSRTLFCPPLSSK
jgi:hypothetical protein